MKKYDSIVRVLGKPYFIKYLNEAEMHGNAGSCKASAQVIFISTSNEKEQVQDTILHEVLHIIDRELVLGLNEETIARLAVGLHSAGCVAKEEHK